MPHPIRTTATACLFASLAVAQQPEPGVTLRLVSEVDAVAPGRTLTLGLSFEHESGWHTYWENPGKVGMAPRLEWRLPDGMTAGPIHWPQPRLTKMGIYTVWGYESDAALLVDIEVPDDLESGSTIEFGLKVFYMACAKTCCPDHKELVIRLPVRTKVERIEPWHARFDEVRRQQPRRLDVDYRIHASRQGETYTLTLTPRTQRARACAIGQLYFFGSDRLVGSDAPQKLRRSGESLVLTMQREPHSPETRERLRGHLFSASGFDPDGEVSALAVDVPIE